MSAYTRLLNLLEADRKAAVSKAGFALGKESIEEAQELASKEADIQKEIRRIERENRKRSSRKGLGGLLGGALGFALAGPLGIGTGLASGLGSLVGTRAAGARNRVEGIDPNLTLDENALFFKGQRENIENVVDDINAQLDEQSRNELTTDILSSIATGATGRRFGQGELGKKISGRASNLFQSLTGRESLDLGQKVANTNLGQRFSNLFGGRGFQTDALLQPDSSLTGLQNILGIDDTPVDQRLEGLFGVQSPQDLTGQTLLDMDSYGQSVLSGGNTTANQLDIINRENAVTMQNLIDLQSLPSTDSLISKYGDTSLMDDMASEFNRFMPGSTRIPGFSSPPQNLFPPEELSGFLPRGGRLSIDDVRQRIVDGIPADYEGDVEQYARDFYGGAGEPPLTPEELTFLTTGQGGPSGFDADLLSGNLQNMVPNFSRARTSIRDLINSLTTSSQQATAPTQSQLDSLQFAINPGLNAPYFANFSSEFNERQIRELLNAPEGDINRLLEFYGIQR